MDRIVIKQEDLWTLIKHHDRVGPYGRYFDEGRNQFFIVKPFRRCRKTGKPQVEITYETSKTIHIII